MMMMMMMMIMRKKAIQFRICHDTEYPIHPKYLQRQVNSVDPDQMVQNTPPDQCLHCLPFIQQFLDTSKGTYCKIDLIF